MSLLGYTVTFIAGLVAGAGLMLLYFQFSMYRQVGRFEEQMDELMDLEEMELPDEAVENKKEEEDGS